MLGNAHQYLYEKFIVCNVYKIEVAKVERIEVAKIDIRTGSVPAEDELGDAKSVERVPWAANTPCSVNYVQETQDIARLRSPRIMCRRPKI
jgi:hypothetical protein